MAATIKEVAKLAGVSYQAVSAVLNGNLGKVSDKTRERIYAAAERVDYRPNQMARTLVSGKSDLIGFVTQDIRSPFYADLTYEVQRQAEERGIRVIIMEAGLFLFVLENMSVARVGYYLWEYVRFVCAII